MVQVILVDSLGNVVCTFPVTTITKPEDKLVFSITKNALEGEHDNLKKKYTEPLNVNIGYVGEDGNVLRIPTYDNTKSPGKLTFEFK